MTSGQKTALSLLISVILFGAFSLAAFAGLFSAIDARFYEPAKISGIRQKLKDIAAASDEYLAALDDRFALGESSFLKNQSVKSFVESKPAQEDVLSRSELLGELRSSTQGFLGFRVLDKNQNSIHFSTFRSDILRRDEKNNLTAYKNYLDCLSPSGEQEIPAQTISCADTSGDLAAGKKIFFDAEGRIVFSFPLYDKYSVFRGTALFYVNALDFSNLLLKRALVSIGEGSVFLSNGLEGEDSLCGYVFGIPSVGQAGQAEFEKGLLDAWKDAAGGVRRLFAIDEKSANYWVALSERGQSGVFASGVYNDEIFSLSFSARALILSCVFVSLFLICFLLLNLRRDDETVIRERIKSLQLGVVDEYLSKKEALDWETISGRRDAVTKEIIHSLGRRAKKRPEQVEALINRSWDELFSAMNLRPKGSNEGGGLENAQEIKAMLQEILSSGAIKVQSVAAAPSAPSAAPAAPDSAPKVPAPAQSVEDLEEVADAEPVEDLEEVEEAEPVEDLEEVADAEPVEDLEDVADAEPVEDLEEVAEAEPVEDLEEVEEAEPVEDLEEVEEAEPVEDLEEIEELEEADEAGAAAGHTADDSVLSLLADEPLNPSGQDYDISEDVASDFFALHEKREESRQNEGRSRDEALDPFFTVRDAFEPDDETETLAENFSIVEPNFRSLDARNSEQTLNGTFKEDKENLVKEVALEDFGVQQDKEKEEFSETLEFGAPDDKKHDDGFDVASTFTTEKPRFERAPFASFSQLRKSAEPSAAPAEPVEAAAAIPLSGKENFMFSSFGQNSNFSELSAAEQEAIVQDSNGVFSITDDLDTDGFVQDNSFKSLVDSVLNNA